MGKRGERAEWTQIQNKIMRKNKQWAKGAGQKGRVDTNSK